MKTYHISDLKKFNRCTRFYYNDLIEEKSEYHPFVRLDEEVTEIAAKKLHIQDCFLGKKGDDPQLAKDALEQYNWLVKARFEYDQLRVKVPFLHRHGEKWDLYFLFIGLYPHADDMQFYNDTVYVLENNGVKIHKIRLIHLNSAYVREGELDVNDLFVISDFFYNGKNHPTIPIKEAMKKNKHDIHATIEAMNRFTKEDLLPPVRSQKCTGRMKCRFYEQCFPNEESIPNHSVLTLTSSAKKYEMLEKGIERLRDAEIAQLEGSRMQYAQVMADRNNGLFVDELALKSWLSRLQYPITFLDFEWERFAIPPYDGMKPYDVLPFEYSIDILQQDGSVEHKVFLSIHDDRYEMAKSLVENIPETGSVVAYNADGAEKIRIQEFADQFEEFRDALLSMNERMEDLQLPFVSGIVYDIRMAGQWSLKKIMSMMDDPGYQDLDIHQGMDAVFQWRHLDYEEDIENRKKVIEDLKKYCGMDTHAMVVVYHWLLSLVQK